VTGVGSDAPAALAAEITPSATRSPSFRATGTDAPRLMVVPDALKYHGRVLAARFPGSTVCVCESCRERARQRCGRPAPPTRIPGGGATRPCISGSRRASGPRATRFRAWRSDSRLERAAAGAAFSLTLGAGKDSTISRAAEIRPGRTSPGTWPAPRGRRARPAGRLDHRAEEHHAVTDDRHGRTLLNHLPGSTEPKNEVRKKWDS
jgi:hypothetical protein